MLVVWGRGGMPIRCKMYIVRSTESSSTLCTEYSPTQSFIHQATSGKEKEERRKKKIDVPHGGQI